jgi:poly-gamma-glutamate capsule biosynthesis protein CapA/YwtB (metallophosphatase superfamily)
MLRSPSPKNKTIQPCSVNANLAGSFTVACVGNIMMEQPILERLRDESPGLLAVLARADLVIGNFESTVIDFLKFDGHTGAQTDFSRLVATPECAPDLKKAGFDMLARANNHVLDWGRKGMQMTDDLLVDAGLVTAGTGDSMSAARAPGYLNGSKARSSLVSWTTTFEPNIPASDAHGQIRARTGASTLRTTDVVLVSSERLHMLQEIRDASPAGAEVPQILRDIDARQGTVTLFGKTYKANPAEALAPMSVVHHRIPDAQDLAEILLNIRLAKERSDFIVASSHTHEPSHWVSTPPDYLQSVAHAAIENGADLFCGHGPHQLRGIEIRSGKPIFYSLGNFCFIENVRGVLPRGEWERRIWSLLENVPHFDPTEMRPDEFAEFQRAWGLFLEQTWFESVVAVTTYDAAGEMRTICLLPIELHWQGPKAQRGLPRLAAPAKGREIMARIKQLSEPYGTVISIDEASGVGTINRLIPHADRTHLKEYQ